MLAIAIALSVLGSALAFEGDCPNITVLHKVTWGDGSWYDACKGLKLQGDGATMGVDACQELCYADMNCSVWQVVKSGPDKAEQCWSGSLVHGCQSRGSESSLEKFEGDLVGGERVQHGFIKVTKEGYTSEQVLGLRHYPEKTGSEATLIERCKENCESTVSCTVWQYGSDGCWMESGPHFLQSGTDANSTWAKGILAGETIEHTCPPYVAPGLPWVWIILGIVLGLIALAAVIYALQKKPKTKKTRAIKMVEKPPAPMPVVYLVQQPTMLIPQTSVVQTYQPVQQVAPMTTYVTEQAPMTTYAAPTTAVTAPLLNTGTPTFLA